MVNDTGCAYCSSPKCIIINFSVDAMLSIRVCRCSKLSSNSSADTKGSASRCTHDVTKGVVTKGVVTIAYSHNNIYFAHLFVQRLAYHGLSFWRLIQWQIPVWTFVQMVLKPRIEIFHRTAGMSTRNQDTPLLPTADHGDKTRSRPQRGTGCIFAHTADFAAIC